METWAIIENHVALSAGDGLWMAVWQEAETEPQRWVVYRFLLSQAWRGPREACQTVGWVLLISFSTAYFAIHSLLLLSRPKSSYPVDRWQIWQISEKLFVLHRCMGLLLKQTGHVTLFNTLSCPSLASSVYQKGNLSHAIMAENKGDEVLCTKKGGDQRALMKSDCAGRVALTPQVVGDCGVPHAAWRQICSTRYVLGEGMSAAVLGMTLITSSVTGILCNTRGVEVAPRFR